MVTFLLKVKKIPHNSFVNSKNTIFTLIKTIQSTLKKTVYILIGIMMLLSATSFSQVNYSFTAATSPYQPISNGTVVTLSKFFPDNISATDEGFSNNVPLGFSFTYGNDQIVNNIKVCTNGFVVLGNDFQDGSNTAQDGYYINNLFEGPCSYNSNTGLNKSGHLDQRSLIAPFWGDLDIEQNTNLVYQTIGNAPNRVFTLEWKNIKWDYQCTAAVGSFQLIIHETTNVIEFAYQNLHGTPSATAKASIGLTSKATGYGSFISLQDNSANPVNSKFLEDNNIVSFPASNSVYRFVPHAKLINNLSISNLYSPGTICKNGEFYSFCAKVFNLGQQTAVHTPVTLTVVGNNSFTSTQYIENLAPGKSALVVFDAFMPGVISTDNIIVTVPSDEDNTDNTISKNISITNNSLNNISFGNIHFQDNGIGNNVPSEFTTRFTAQNFKSINQISLYFSNETNNAPFDITVYEADGLDNKPGTILWQQKGLSSQPGLMNVSIAPGITVHGQYFIAVTQTGNTNLSYAYEAESPLEPNSYYYRTPLNSNWIDISTENNKYKLLMGVQYDNTLPVTSTRLTGFKLGEKNVLKWNTYTEVNNDHFIIERSTNGHEFIALATVNTQAPMGNSTATITYSYTDAGTPPINAYYRLRQVNKQSVYALSDVVMLKGEGKLPFEVNNIFPNPVQSVLKLNYTAPSAGNNTLILVDPAGKMVKQLVFTSTEGANQRQVDVSEIATGTYFLQLLSASGKSNVISVIKK